jgi:phenylalanyl-tRNA synthetase beta chain
VNKVELFDTFKGEGIEKGQKACAFTVTLQAEDRTLTDDEMTNIQQKIFENLQKAGGTIRGL